MGKGNDKVVKEIKSIQEVARGLSEDGESYILH